MSDCANVEIRELLPDFLHDFLAASERVRVTAHLATCEECTSELATLRAVRHAYSRAPEIDTAAILRALPHPPRVRARLRSPSRAVAWQIAAAISFISLGGISLAVAKSFFGDHAPMTQIDSAVRSPSVVGTASTATVANGRPAITFAGGVSDLAAEDVEKLLGSVESLEAAPPADPEAVSANDIGRVKSDTSGE